MTETVEAERGKHGSRFRSGCDSSGFQVQNDEDASGTALNEDTNGVFDPVGTTSGQKQMNLLGALKEQHAVEIRKLQGQIETKLALKDDALQNP